MLNVPDNAVEQIAIVTDTDVMGEVK